MTFADSSRHGMSGPEGILTPPAVEGGSEAEVEYHGDGPLYYRIDFGPWEELPTDADGRGKIKAPKGGTVVTISTRTGPNSAFAEIPITSSGP